jgi:ribonucleotide reductase beta subunit family protein with ferritin-like domain
MSQKTGKVFSSQEAFSPFQLYPSTFPAVQKFFERAIGNTWTPNEAPLGEDKMQWQTGKITDAEKLMVKRVLGLTAGGESLVANNLLVVVGQLVGDPECQQYVARQMNEELIHNWTVADCCGSFELEVKDVYEAYQNIPAVKALTDFMSKTTSDFTNMILDQDQLIKDFEERIKDLQNSKELLDLFRQTIKPYAPDVNTVEGMQKIVKDLVVFYIFTEGILFFATFAMILSLRQRNLLPGLSKQVEYTMRDECVSEDTETLTSQGWLPVNLVKYDTFVAQYHKDTNYIDFTRPKNISQTVPETFYDIDFENFLSQRVTPQHRTLVHTPQGLEVILAKDLDNVQGLKNQLLTASAPPKSEGNPGIDSFTRVRLAVELFGRVPVEGPKANMVTIRKVNEANVLKLDTLLKITRPLEREIELAEGKSFYIHVSERWVKSPWSAWISKAIGNPQWGRAFLRSLVNLLEPIHKDKIPLSKEHVKHLQAIAVSCGCTIAKVPKPDAWVSGDSQDFYRIYDNADRVPMTGTKITLHSNVDGITFYGIEVESGFIIIRRKGLCSLTGNSVHVEFGTFLINEIRSQKPEVFTEAFENDLADTLTQAVDLAKEFVADALPEDIIGLTREYLHQYVEYLANIRISRIGLSKPRYAQKEHPLPWLQEIAELRKEQNFFEQKVTEYRKSGTIQGLDDF